MTKNGGTKVMCCFVFSKLHSPIAQISLITIHTYLQFWINSPSFFPPNRFIGNFGPANFLLSIAL